MAINHWFCVCVCVFLLFLKKKILQRLASSVFLLSGWARKNFLGERQAVKRRGGREVLHLSKEKPLFPRGTWSNISSFVSQIDDLRDGWCSVVLCGIVLSSPTQRGWTLIISGLCIEQGARVVRLEKKGVGVCVWGVSRRAGVPPIKREMGLMTAEADGGSHLPWRRSQKPPPWCQRRTDGSENVCMFHERVREVLSQGDFKQTVCCSGLFGGFQLTVTCRRVAQVCWAWFGISFKDIVWWERWCEYKRISAKGCFTVWEAVCLSREGELKLMDGLMAWIVFLFLY